jgi:hypothetical protein
MDARMMAPRPPHPSVDNTDVRVHYPFHPLQGVTLRVLRRPKRGEGGGLCPDPADRRLKIPIWMLLPECAEATISQRTHPSKQALVISRFTDHLTTPKTHDNLRQTRIRSLSN